MWLTDVPEIGHRAFLEWGMGTEVIETEVVEGGEISGDASRPSVLAILPTWLALKSFLIFVSSFISLSPFMCKTHIVHQLQYVPHWTSKYPGVFSAATTALGSYESPTRNLEAANPTILCIPVCPFSSWPSSLLNAVSFMSHHDHHQSLYFAIYRGKHHTSLASSTSVSCALVQQAFTRTFLPL